MLYLLFISQLLTDRGLKVGIYTVLIALTKMDLLVVLQ